MPDDNNRIFLATSCKGILDNLFRKESVFCGTENTICAEMHDFKRWNFHMCFPAWNIWNYFVSLVCSRQPSNIIRITSRSCAKSLHAGFTECHFLCGTMKQNKIYLSSSCAILRKFPCIMCSDMTNSAYQKTFITFLAVRFQCTPYLHCRCAHSVLKTCSTDSRK
jgi:hypothetical protein